MNMQKIVIGTRGSKLALKQANIVNIQLQKLLPRTKIEIKIIKTKGDKDMAPIPLDTVGKGWFTKEIDKQLLEENIDLAVHSLKDIPEELPVGLIIAAIPVREDPREALISKNGLVFEKLAKGAIIGTDSARRKSQVLFSRPDLKVESLRGNVNTRLDKLKMGMYDAVILAAAGLIRLGLEDKITQYFDPTEFIPSPGQGALAIVTKKNNLKLTRVLKKLNDLQTIQAVNAERAFSAALGGGCRLPIGAYALVLNKKIRLYGIVGSLDGIHLVKDSLEGEILKPLELGRRLGTQLLKESQEWHKK